MKTAIVIWMGAAALLISPVAKAQVEQQAPSIELSITILEGAKTDTQLVLKGERIRLDQPTPWNNKPTPWNKHRQSQADTPTLEFTAAEPETLNIRLVPDTFEATLEMEARLKLLDAVDFQLKRPPLISVVFGSNAHFKGVVSRRQCIFNRASTGRPSWGQCVLELIHADKAETTPPRQ